MKRTFFASLAVSGIGMAHTEKPEDYPAFLARGVLTQVSSQGELCRGQAPAYTLIGSLRHFGVLFEMVR